MRAETTNRFIAAASLIGLVVVACALGLLAPAQRRIDFVERPSSFFSDDTGTRALLLVMRKVLPYARQWRRPLLEHELHQGAIGADTLLAIGPRFPLTPGEALALRSWIAGGGQLILLSKDGWQIAPSNKRPCCRCSAPPRNDDSGKCSACKVPPQPKKTFLGQLGVRLQPGFPEAAVKTTLVPTGKGTPLPNVRVWTSPAATWEGTFQQLALAEEQPIAIAVTHGEGRVVALADPRFATNEALRKADNAVWLVSLCALWGNGGAVIDEYHHGFRHVRSPAGLTLSFLGTPWGWCILQLGVAGALYAFLYRRRIGRPIELHTEHLRATAHLVQARARLFEAAQAHELAAEAIFHELATAVTGRPLPKDQLPAFLRERKRRSRSKRLTELFGELEHLLGREPYRGRERDRNLLRLARLSGLLHEELKR